MPKENNDHLGGDINYRSMMIEVERLSDKYKAKGLGTIGLHVFNPEYYSLYHTGPHGHTNTLIKGGLIEIDLKIIELTAELKAK